MNTLSRPSALLTAIRPGSRTLSALTWLLALALCAALAVDLLWRHATPRPPALPVAMPVDPQQAAEAIASRHLMGHATAAATDTVTATVAGRFVLRAVVTGSDGRPGWAVIATEGAAQQGYVEGQSVEAGISLARVGEDHVELAEGPRRHTLNLNRPPAEGIVRTLSVPPSTPASAAALTALPQ
jgi:hypothetical protein